MAAAGTTWPLLSTLLSDSRSWSTLKLWEGLLSGNMRGGSGTRGSVGMGRRGEGCERRWRGALERIAWWIPTVKSDSYLKPSILVLCDTAKEPVTRTGGSQGGMSGSGGIIFCKFLFNWTADKNETTSQELQMLSSVTFIASSLCLSLFEVFSCLNWHRRDLVRLGITCNSGINPLKEEKRKKYYTQKKKYYIQVPSRESSPITKLSGSSAWSLWCPIHQYFS